MNNPHNPTGALIDTPLLEEICSIAEEEGAYVLCDKYEGPVRDAAETTLSAFG